MGELKRFQCKKCYERFSAPLETRICPICNSQNIVMLKWHKDFKDPQTWLFVFMFFQTILCFFLAIISYVMKHPNYGALFIAWGIASLPLTYIAYKHAPNKILVIRNSK